MNKVIELGPYIEKRKLIEQAKNILPTLKDVDKKDYSNMSYLQLMERIRGLETRHSFDLNFLRLVDVFMRRNYPEYYWRFDIFLDEIELTNKPKE